MVYTVNNKSFLTYTILRLPEHLYMLLLILFWFYVWLKHPLLFHWEEKNCGEHIKCVLSSVDTFERGAAVSQHW